MDELLAPPAAKKAKVSSENVVADVHEKVGAVIEHSPAADSNVNSAGVDDTRTVSNEGDGYGYIKTQDDTALEMTAGVEADRILNGQSDCKAASESMQGDEKASEDLTEKDDSTTSKSLECVKADTDMAVTDLRIVQDYHMLEKDVGIEEYISTLPGFQAVIKQRYSDFLVNEISQDGRVVHLTSTELPCAVPGASGKVESDTDSITAGLINNEDAAKLKELLEEKDKNKIVLIQVGEDKAERTKIHSVIEKGFPGLESSTVTKGDKKYIQVQITSNKGNGLQRWPKGRGFYCKFVLYKEAKDTMDAIGLISNKLRLKSGLFQYAGTKDKRAKTSQEVTVFKVAAEKLLEVNKKLRNIVTGNYSYTSEKLTLGQLQGNKFTIVLRSVDGTPDQIEAGMTSLKDRGFINYYGMQRFGVTSVPTHHIGRALLCSKWKEVVEMILKPRPGEEQQLSEAREFWWTTRDSKAALSKFPRFSYIEKNILQGLVDRGDNDYMAAINRVARNTRLMYVHAYQSYIWNTVVSHRMKKHGLKLVHGDLVVPRNLADFADENEEHVNTDKKRVTPVVIDSSTIDEYTIYDIVLPKPGYDVIYPRGDLEAIYKDLMERDGIDYLSMKSKYKDYSLSGDYRHMLVKPADVTWEMFRYNDVNVPLALSDWDKMNNEPEPKSIPDGASLALRVEFTLPSSCYATMALRELLKIDTSSAYQATLNT